MTQCWTIQKFHTLDSTQNELRRQFQNNKKLEEGTTIQATEQTGGQGRHGRTWESVDGNLFFSFLLRPECRVEKVGQTSLLTSLALKNLIHDITNRVPTLKWPNDVLVNGKKISGVLLESLDIKNNQIGVLMIGVGINIKNAPNQISSAFLEELTEHTLDPEHILQQFLTHFFSLYRQWKTENFESFRRDWLEHSYERGHKVSVKIGETLQEGRFENIDRYGNLILICGQSGDKTVITSGDIYSIGQETNATSH